MAGTGVPTATQRTIGHPPPAVRRLLAAGLAVFVITIVIGILNGIDAVEFGRSTILTHVHAGTLGWLTLAIVAGAIWMFDPASPTADRLGNATIIAVLIYIVGFWTGNDVFRPIAGTLMFVVVIGLVGWVLARRSGAMHNVPRLAMILALFSLLVGAVLGVLLGLAVTGKADWVPDGVAESHPPTMVIGYLVLAAIGLAEWLLTGDQTAEAATAAAAGERPTLGLVQVLFVFLAGLCLVVGIISGIEPLIILNAPLELIGLGIFYKRLWPQLRATDWRTSGPGRWIGAGAIYLLLDLILLLYLIGSTQGNFDDLRLTLLLALDHMMFVGALTGILFAMVALATDDTPSPAEEISYWGVVLGLAVFVLGLLADVVWLKRIGTPILGLALLHVIAVSELRLTGRRGGQVVAP